MEEKQKKVIFIVYPVVICETRPWASTGWTLNISQSIDSLTDRQLQKTKWLNVKTQTLLKRNGLIQKKLVFGILLSFNWNEIGIYYMTWNL